VRCIRKRLGVCLWGFRRRRYCPRYVAYLIVDRLQARLNEV